MSISFTANRHLSLKPARRRWLSIAFLTIILGAIVAACGDGDLEQQNFSSSSANTGSQTDNAIASTVDLAPELGDIDNWYNSEPTSLADLRGNPVLLVFWADY